MKDSHKRAVILVATLLLLGASRTRADEILSTPLSPFAGGEMQVFWKSRPEAASLANLLIHFHGTPDVVKQSFARSDRDGVLAVITFPGLSKAYSTPFETDAGLFSQILDRARVAIGADEAFTWRSVCVSCFSAGYGAVREILKTPQHFDRIDAIVAADSIYAGLQREQPDREVDEQNMRDFLRFAAFAVEGEKTFVISHSALPTPYASTMETADYLLRSLRIDRQPDDTIRADGMRQLSRASRGRFLVLGFDGDTGKDHIQHLHNVHLLWKHQGTFRQLKK